MRPMRPISWASIVRPLRAPTEAGLRRLGFPADAYVLALVGGTGVGKSSLLNAIAGDVVSTASVRRPTTSEPVAWIPRAEKAALGPLLDWLEVDQVSEHEAAEAGPVAILDLPDVDSIAVAHRARVEALLPLVDGVAWVTDPEKYADAVLHDDFLRSWLPRLGRQVVLVNKSDRLAKGDARRVQRDLEATLASDAGRGSEVAVLLTSATSEQGTAELRAWLAAGADAKRIVRQRIAASILTAVRGLASASGDMPGSSGKPLLDGAARDAAVRAATSAVLRVVDLPALERQAVAATRASARSRGAGPLGRLTSFIYRTSGRESAVADPNRFPPALARTRQPGVCGRVDPGGLVSTDPRCARRDPAGARGDARPGGSSARSRRCPRSCDRRRRLGPASGEPLVDRLRPPSDPGDSRDRAVGGLGRPVDPGATGDGIDRRAGPRGGPFPLRRPCRIPACRLCHRATPRGPRRLAGIAVVGAGP